MLKDTEMEQMQREEKTQNKDNFVTSES